MKNFTKDELSALGFTKAQIDVILIIIDELKCKASEVASLKTENLILKNTVDILQEKKKKKK